MMKSSGERNLIFVESLSFSFVFVPIFFFFFFFFFHLVEIDPIKFVNFKKGLAEFHKKIFKNQCFSSYVDMLVICTVISRSPVRRLTFVLGVIKFWTDATAVGGKSQRISN